MSSLLALLFVTTAMLVVGCARGGADDLEKRVSDFVSSYPHATIAVAVIDPQTGYDFDINGDSLIHAASTMKVPVLIEVYRRAREGEFSLDDSIDVRNEFTSIYDGSTFSIALEDDSDKEIYASVGQKMTIRDLAYRLITTSSNLATNELIDLVSADSVQRTIESLGTTRMQVLRGVEDLKAFHAGMNNVATARDLAILMKSILDGRAASDEASLEMINILSAVPSFRMISAGVPEGARVAHKTGSIPTRNHRHDSAIVFPSAGEPYVIVILTRDTDSVAEAEEIGATLSRIVYEELRGPYD